MRGSNVQSGRRDGLVRGVHALELVVVLGAAVVGLAPASGSPPNGAEGNTSSDSAAQKAGAYEQTVTSDAKVLIAKADFNGDGEPDYLTLDATSHFVTVYLAWKGHGFVRQDMQYLIGDGPNTLIAGDFKVNDTAGCDDVAIGSAGGNSIDLYAGQPYTVDSASKTAFQFIRLVPIPALDPTCIALGKFDHEYDKPNEFMDLLIVKAASPKTLELWAGNGAGAFASAGKPSTSPNDVIAIWPGEHTGDKYVDIVTVDAGGVATLMKNDGTGKLIP